VGFKEIDMALAKKNTRLLTVEGPQYRWTVSPDDEPGMGIVVKKSNLLGQRMVTWVEHGNIVSPWLVREAIIHALSHGWQPQARGREDVFRFENLYIKELHRRRTTELCNQALEAVKMVISKQNYDDVHDYINQYGELGLGIELLIDWLLDSEIKITRAQLKCIEKAKAVMGLSNTERLKKNFEYRQRGIAKGSRAVCISYSDQTSSFLLVNGGTLGKHKLMIFQSWERKNG
jgi:hypothetical protein